MSDATPQLPGDDIPEAVVAPKRRYSVSIVWLVPLVAAAIGLWIAWEQLSQRGPTVTILFRSAEGLEVGKTKVSYKNVNVGTVTAIGLSEDRLKVRVTAEFQRGTEDWLVSSTRFWVVRPRIGTSGVSGLSTLLSGAYIGMEVGETGERQRVFEGLEVPPAVSGDVPGRRFTLKSDTLGSLDIGSPIYYRRIPVGQVVSYSLDKEGRQLSVGIFVHAPYDQYVTSETRFWQASGLDVSVNASGVSVNTESLAALLAGGIAFETRPDAPAAKPADAGYTFALFGTRTAAMARRDREVVSYVFYFRDSLRGLAVGAPVEFRGIVVGEVKEIDFEWDEQSKYIYMPVTIDLYPERFRPRRERDEPPIPETERKSNIDALVGRGMRAQLRSGNLLTGQLYVALDFFDNVKPAKVNWAAKPPVLPTTPGTMTQLEQSLGRIVKKLEDFPLESIGRDTQQALVQLDATLKSVEKVATRVEGEVAPGLRATLDQAKQALAAAEKTMQTTTATVSANGAIATDAREAIREITRAMQSIRVLADYLERHPEALIRGKAEPKPESTSGARESQP